MPLLRVPWTWVPSPGWSHPPCYWVVRTCAVLPSPEALHCGVQCSLKGHGTGDKHLCVWVKPQHYNGGAISLPGAPLTSIYTTKCIVSSLTLNMQIICKHLTFRSSEEICIKCIGAHTQGVGMGSFFAHFLSPDYYATKASTIINQQCCAVIKRHGCSYAFLCSVISSAFTKETVNQAGRGRVGALTA